MLKSLTLENFKSISSPVEIELRPLTLLFGPNGAGKSVVADAMRFSLELLTGAFPSRVTGQRFRECAHRHDENKPIRLRFGFGFGTGEEYDPKEEDDLLKIVGRGECAAVQFKVELKGGQPTVTETVVEIDGVTIATIVGPSRDVGHPVQARVNFGHPILEIGDEFERPGWRKDDEAWESAFFKRRKLLYRTSGLIALNIPDTLPLAEFDVAELPYGVYEVPAPPKNALKHYLTVLWYLLAQPVDRLRMELANVRYVGLGRGRIDESETHPRQQIFGLQQCCNVMLRDDQLHKVVSARLGDPKGLAIPLSVEMREPWQSARRRSDSNADLATLAKLDEIRNAGIDRLRSPRIIFVDERTETELEISQLSVGTATALPVVVACLDSENAVTYDDYGYAGQQIGMVVIEEPESNLHPTAAAAMGDLLVDAALRGHEDFGGKQILAETHSEYLTLRILRRLREEPRDYPPTFTEADIAIYYFSGKAFFGSPFALRVDRDGRLLQPWPDDFFSQDSIDRFS
jgi:hypothetical protein